MNEAAATVEEQNKGDGQESQEPTLDTNKLFKDAYNQGREKAHKDFQSMLTEKLGTTDLDEVVQRIQNPQPSAETEQYKKQVEELRQSLSTTNAKLQEYETKAAQAQTDSILSDALSALKPKTEAAAKAIKLSFKESYNLKDGKVYQKGSEVPMLDAKTGKEMTPSDIFNQWKSGEYQDFFTLDSTVKHVGQPSPSGTKEEYVPTPAQMKDPAFLNALKATKQNARLFQRGHVDMRAIEHYMNNK